MDIAFAGERDRFFVIYLDDITVFSKSDEEHLMHLKHTSGKCRKYGLSLNPKKFVFVVEEGKFIPGQDKFSQKVCTKICRVGQTHNLYAEKGH